jgi:hypothetical protein
MFIYKFWFSNKIKIWCVEDMIRRIRWFSLNPPIFDMSKIWFAVPADFRWIRWFPLVSPKFSLFAVSKFADVSLSFRYFLSLLQPLIQIFSLAFCFAFLFRYFSSLPHLDIFLRSLIQIFSLLLFEVLINVIVSNVDDKISYQLHRDQAITDYNRSATKQ